MNSSFITSYDRSGATGLDYAVNRTYNSGQSRFTQVDPIGMADSNLINPQSNNLFAYTRNNPVDFVDPSGLNLAAPQYSCTTTRVWGHFEDGNGNITGYASYSSTVCQEVGGDGGSEDEEPGGGGSSGEPECATYRDLLSLAQPLLNDAWEKSQKFNRSQEKRREFGGSVFLNRNNDVRYEQREGVVGSMGRFSGDSLAAFRAVRKRPDFGVYLFSFHTHPGRKDPEKPSGRPNSVSSRGDYAVLTKPDSDLGIRPAPPFGIIKYGPRDKDITLYTRSGVIANLDKNAICVGSKKGKN